MNTKGEVLSVHVQVLEIFLAGATATESPGRSWLALKGCSPGQGLHWSREMHKEGEAAETCREGLTATLSPSPAPLVG